MSLGCLEVPQVERQLKNLCMLVSDYKKSSGHAIFMQMKATRAFAMSHSSGYAQERIK